MTNAPEPLQSDPWAWAQWAKQQDPGTFALGGGTLADNPDFVKTSSGMLRQAGLWNPAWDDWLNYQEGNGESNGSGTFAGVPDLSSLAGYSLQNTRGPGHSAFLELLGPNGQQAGLEQYEQSGSWKSSDYAQMAAVAAAMFGGGLALNGGFAGLGGAAGAGAPIAGGTGLGGAAGLEASIAALNGMALPAAPAVLGGQAALGAGGLTAAGAVAGGGSPGWAAGLDAIAAPAAGGSTGILSSIGNALSGLGSANSLANLAQGAIGLYGQNKALGAMKDATNQSNEFNRYAFDQIRADNKPLVDLRNGVLPQIQALLSNPGSITSDPGYQFQFNEGTKALNNGAAARGMTYSGAQGKALQRYGNDYGSTKLDQSLNRLTTVAGLGQVGSNSNNAATQQFANNQSDNALNMGNARGSAYIGGANIAGNALSRTFNPYQYDQINRRGP